MKTTKSPKFLKQRRFLVAVPVLVLPFALLLFWSLGGGSAAEASETHGQQGLMKTLPDARLDDKNQVDKLKYYENAAANAVKQTLQRKFDPEFPEIAESDLAALDPEQNRLNGFSYTGGSYNDPVANKVYKKLEQLDEVLNQPDNSAKLKKEKGPGNRITKENQSGYAEMDQLTSMMQQMTGGKQEDHELSQLQSLLEKIQEIQHPGLVTRKLAAESKTSLGSIYQATPAMIAKNQRITDGTVVELRLLDSIVINGQDIPKGHKIYGLAIMSNQRMSLVIKYIGIGKAIIPVDLTVFDQRDSMEGIYVPEATTSEAIRGGTDNALQGLQILSMDQSVGTQLAGAGISAAKGLFSKKVRMLKGKVKAGYPVLLRNNQD